MSSFNHTGGGDLGSREWSARLFKSSTPPLRSSPSLFPLPKSLPHNYCATTHRPERLLLIIHYQNPIQTVSIFDPALRLPSTSASKRPEPPAISFDLPLSHLSHLLAPLCPSICTEGYGGRRWEIVS